MTKASAIRALTRSPERAERLAGEFAIARDQDWNTESTVYTFDDDSRLVFSGPCMFSD